MEEKEAIKLILDKYKDTLHQPFFNSPHEGYAVLKAALDELWEDIKGNANEKTLSMEAKHVGAMAIKFLVSCC